VARHAGHTYRIGPSSRGVANGQRGRARIQRGRADRREDRGPVAPGDYPAERRQILVVSDASTDRTDEIVTGYASQGVELMRMPVRTGKAAAENASRSRLRGDIIINSDAPVRMSPSGIRLLVLAMTDPTVGVTSTRDVSVVNFEGAGNATEARYAGYEMWLRRLETLAGGIVGASGSGYAIRRTLHDMRIPDHGRPLHSVARDVPWELADNARPA
jgi:glycosyltransferase involved in cell wall biosynthesis